MESDRVILGAVIFIVMVLGANLVMYAAARGAARSGGKSFLETLGQSLKNPSHPKEDAMQELHRRIQELEQGKGNESADPE